MKHSRSLCIGPGGRKCNCCFPAPGSKARKLEYRRAKRTDEREAMKCEKTSDDWHAEGRTKAGNSIC